MAKSWARTYPSWLWADGRALHGDSENLAVLREEDESTRVFHKLEEGLYRVFDALDRRDVWILEYWDRLRSERGFKVRD